MSTGWPIRLSRRYPNCRSISVLTITVFPCPSNITMPFGHASTARRNFSSAKPRSLKSRFTLKLSTARPDQRNLVSSPGTQRNAKQIGDVFGSELSHKMRAVRLEGARADSQSMAAFLVGSPRDDQCEHLALARRQGMLAEDRWRPRCVASRATVLPQVDRLTATRDGGIGICRRFKGADLLHNLPDAFGRTKRHVHHLSY